MVKILAMKRGGRKKVLRVCILVYNELPHLNQGEMQIHNERREGGGVENRLMFVSSATLKTVTPYLHFC